LGLVDIIAPIIDATLKIMRIKIGIMIAGLAVAGLARSGMKLAMAREIIMALTESRMFALASAISLNFRWLRMVTLKRV